MMKRIMFVISAVLILFSLAFYVADERRVDFPDKLESLRLAVEDISTMNVDNFNKKEYLNLISELKTDFIEEKYVILKKEILLKNSLLNNEIIFITRNQYKPDHHNTATLFQTGEINTQSFDPGGAMKTFHPVTGKVRTIFKTEDGIIRDPEVSFDGEKIIVSHRKNIEDDYHIYEINPDGSDFKQLTSAPGISDIDPLYLPDGGIIFSATREPKYCMCNRHIMANMYRMDDDGANITQLGQSTLFEGHPALLNDGRVVYDRWEYIDRNFGDAQGLWTSNPDGTNHALFYGNNTNSPGGIIDPRPIPGSNLVLCIFSSCHDRPWGALTLIDRSKGVEGKDAVVNIWPSKAFDLIGQGNWDMFMSLDVRYEDPFPLNEKYFLCSKSIYFEREKKKPLKEKMGIYLVDVFGNELLLHEEEKGCYDPMPLAKRFMPPAIPQKRNYSDNPGYFYVQNVYEGTHMEGVEKGSIKYLRVVESPPKQTWSKEGWNGQGQQAPGMNWHSFENKQILGTVEVASDGSVFFEIPSSKYVYFQLLDENKKMIQSMRSGIIVHSGETNGCIGCHEDRLSAPLGASSMAMAMKSSPQKMNGWKGQTRKFNYLRDVQPIFDKSCIQCHDFGKEAGEKLILAGDKNPYFNASYVDLYVKKKIKCVGAGPSDIQKAYSWGSHQSKLAEVIESNHHDIKLTEEEKQVLYTWMDLNGVYYPEYETAYPNNPAGRSPITNEQLNRLGELTGVEFNKLKGHGRKLGPQISFERPELSPCLSSIKDDGVKYSEALAIIKQGNKKLQETPRADMEGFVPCEEHQRVLRKYIDRANTEKESRSAIANGKKIYDMPSQN